MAGMPEPVMPEPVTPEPDSALTTFVLSAMPFAAALGLRVHSSDKSRVVASADWRADLCTTGGSLHGGALMAMADTIGALAAAQHLLPGAGTTTIESKTNFLRGVTDGEITITSTPIHAGRTTIVVQTDITRTDGKLITRTTQTQAVLAPR